MSHAWNPVAATMPLRATTMIRAPAFSTLVSAAGFPLRSLASLAAAGLRTVNVAAVTQPADDELLPAERAIIYASTENQNPLAIQAGQAA